MISSDIVKTVLRKMFVLIGNNPQISRLAKVPFLNMSAIHHP